MRLWCVALQHLMAVGCNILNFSIMKRYLYILLAALVALTACDSEITIQKNKVVAYVISDKFTIETTESSATIATLKPHMVVNGVHVENATIYMEYWVEGNDTAKHRVDKYTESNSYITFAIEGLAPETTYAANIAIGEAELGEEKGNVFTFTTKAHIPIAEYSCECEVEAKGVLANVALKSLSFTLDGVESPLAKVEFKYALSLSGGDWTTVEVSPEQLAEGFRIPAEGESYLKEESKYNYTVTLYPEATNYKEYTINGKFETTTAVLSTENLAAPTLTADKQNISLTAAMPTLYVDDVVIPEYGEVKYLFYYTDDNGHSDTIEAVLTEGVMSATATIGDFKQGATYRFYTRLDINDTDVIDSDEAAEYTMPKEETPAPPTPPVSGDADTTAIAGEWHLTSWRGAEPSFDVYLSITKDGVVSLFQRIESRLWETFFSLVGYEGGIIDGEYTDGVKWAHAYYVVVEGNTMTWTSTTDPSEISVYTRCTLPDFTNPDIRTYATMGTRWF